MVISMYKHVMFCWSLSTDLYRFIVYRTIQLVDVISTSALSPSHHRKWPSTSPTMVGRSSWLCGEMPNIIYPWLYRVVSCCIPHIWPYNCWFSALSIGFAGNKTVILSHIYSFPLNPSRYPEPNGLFEITFTNLYSYEIPEIKKQSF